MINDFQQPNKQNSAGRFALNQSFKPSTGAPPPPPPKKSRFNLRDFWQRLSRRQKIVVSLVTLLILAGAASAIYTNFFSSSPNPVTSKVTKKPKAPTTVASPLTGVQVAPDLAKRPVTGIMIENSPDSRPQSGIQDAGVIFEAIAEGGITRFLTLYQEGQPGYIGPVRSLRPYYIDWAASFDASIAHVGGSPDALSQIRNGGKDLDQFFNPGAYERVSYRAAPHNVYTNSGKMDALNRDKGYNSSKFTPWPRKADSKLTTPTAKNIDLSISGPLYHVHYNYDPVSNLYLRHEGGPPHNATTSASDPGSQLRPKVVIALVMGYGIAGDGQHSEYQTTGSGSVYIFQDGGVTEGTWTKPDRNSQIEFKDKNGAPIKLNAGQAWVTAVQGGQMTYAP